MAIHQKAVVCVAIVLLTWQHAQFCVGGCFGSRLVVDGKVVEIRSKNLHRVWFAPGWNADKVDQVVKVILTNNGGKIGPPPH